MPATCTDPPTAGGAVGRGFAARTRHAAAERADRAQRGTRCRWRRCRPRCTSARRRRRSRCRRRAACSPRCSGWPPRPKTIGSGFWLCSVSSMIIWFRSFCACSADGRGAGGDDVRSAGRSRPPEDTDDLAEAAELEVLGDVQRLVHAHEHALVPLEGRRARRPAASRRSGATVPVPQVATLASASDLRLALELAPRCPVTATTSPSATRSFVAVEDEDAVGGRRVRRRRSRPGGRSRAARGWHPRSRRRRRLVS